MRVASGAADDGGAAGGVIGGGALGDIDGEGAAGDGPGDVGDGAGERAMVMLAFRMGWGVAWDAMGGGHGLCTGWWWCWWCHRRGRRREVTQQVMVLRAMLVVRVFWAIAVGTAGGAGGRGVAGAVVPCVMQRVLASLVMSRVLQVCRRCHGCCSVSRGGWCL